MTPRRMTEQEHKQGYVILDCGCCVWVWRSSVLMDLRDKDPNYVDKIKLSCYGDVRCLPIELFKKEDDQNV